MRTTTIGDSGDITAAPGSQPWSVAVRLKLHCALKDVRATADSIEVWMEVLEQHQGYRSLSGRDGKPFRSLGEFCCAPHPYGLGYSREAIDCIVGERKEAERKRKTLEAAKRNTKPLNAKAGRPEGEMVPVSEKGTITKGSNSAQYRIRKLRRDHPEVAERLDAGEFASVAEAERVARGEPAKLTRKVPSALEQLRRWWERACQEERQEFLREVSHA